MILTDYTCQEKKNEEVAGIEDNVDTLRQLKDYKDKNEEILIAANNNRIDRTTITWKHGKKSSSMNISSDK